MFDNERIIWAAGFVDGEGNIRFQRDKRGYGRFVLDVAQVDPRPLYRLADLFGGKVYGPYEPKTKNSRPYYRWAVAWQIAKRAIEYMYPYFVVKKEQADEAINKYNDYQSE